MTIVVSLLHLPYTTPTPAADSFYVDSFMRIACDMQEHQFIFITGQDIKNLPTGLKNITTIISQPKVDTPLLWKFWLRYTLPGIAKKCKADIILHINGTCSLNTKLPQYLIVNELSILMPDNFYSKKAYFFLKANTPAFLQRSSAIITSSHFLKNKIMELYNIPDNRIEVIYPPLQEPYQQFDWEEKEDFKKKNTEGKEYFLCVGDIDRTDNLIHLLKAFSFFKKRQKSNMKLLIAASSVSEENSFYRNLKTYKYRDDVKVIAGLSKEDLVRFTAAAYGFIYPYGYELFPAGSILAIRCGVPVITGTNNTFKEIFNDAVLYVDPANFEDIAHKMMLVFKDEAIRSELIEQGKIRAQSFSEEKSESSLHQSLTKWTTTR